MDSQMVRKSQLPIAPPLLKDPRIPPVRTIHPLSPLKMGACLGRCIAEKSSCLKRWRSTDEHETELMTEDDEDLAEKANKRERKLIFRIIKFKRKTRRQFVDKFMEHQDLNYSRLSRAPTAELTDIQLQSLDAQTLLVTAASKDIMTTNTFAPVPSSRTSSSLDLEWEHEYGHTNRLLSRSWLFIDAPADDNNPVDEGEISDDNRLLFSSPPSDEISLKQPLCNFTSPTSKANPNHQPNFTRTWSRTSWSHISTPESLEWDVDEEQRNQMHLEDDNLDDETLELLHQIEMLKNKVLNETGDGLEGIEFNKTMKTTDS